jgi:hypothetical protein
VEVRRPQPGLLGAVQDGHARLARGDLVGEPSGAVRGAVVDHEHIGVRYGGQEPVDEPAEVLRLVVGGDHHHHAVATRGAHRAPPAGDGSVSGTAGVPAVW